MDSSTKLVNFSFMQEQTLTTDLSQLVIIVHEIRSVISYLKAAFPMTLPMRSMKSPKKVIWTTLSMRLNLRRPIELY